MTDESKRTDLPSHPGHFISGGILYRVSPVASVSAKDTDAEEIVASQVTPGEYAIIMELQELRGDLKKIYDDWRARRH